MQKCFFCDVQKQQDRKKILENKDFFCRFDDFPVSRGHLEVISKSHISSFFNLSSSQITNLYDLINRVKKHLEDKFKPDGFNVGINEGEAGGQSIPHLHIHIIPRYKGDVKNPRGGVRNIFSEKADYIPKAKNMPLRKNYVSHLSIEYNKLVRDKIPEICRQDGETPEYHILSQTKFKKELKRKLVEESQELIAAPKPKLKNEIVDVYEVLLNLAKTFGFRWSEIEKLRQEKNKKRGSFKKRYFLVSSKK